MIHYNANMFASNSRHRFRRENVSQSINVFTMTRGIAFIKRAAPKHEHDTRGQGTVLINYNTNMFVLARTAVYVSEF